MVEYLQSLSEKNLKLIFEFAPLVFAESVDLGVQVYYLRNITIKCFGTTLVFQIVIDAQKI